MTDRSKQIIPDSQAVVSCFNPETLEILDSHGTFIISELLEIIQQPISQSFSKEKVDILFQKVRSVGSYTNKDFLNELIKDFIVMESIMGTFINGTECNLLQPDGKGWQKGKLKICFEFVPEESDSLAHQIKSVEVNSSPLDEIRQLSNELASVGSIEQN
jgi:KGK domain